MYMYIHVRIDIIVWMCGIYSLSLSLSFSLPLLLSLLLCLSLSFPPCFSPPSPSLSLSLYAVPGLFCARHNQDCDSINGCDDISFCDRDLNVTHHDPAHESCIALVSLDNGEFVIGVRSYTHALHMCMYSGTSLCDTLRTSKIIL